MYGKDAVGIQVAPASIERAMSISVEPKFWPQTTTMVPAVSVATSRSTPLPSVVGADHDAPSSIERRTAMTPRFLDTTIQTPPPSAATRSSLKSALETDRGADQVAPPSIERATAIPGFVVHAVSHVPAPSLA